MSQVAVLNQVAGGEDRVALVPAGVLDAADNVIILPGYGMAVAQAQHKVRDPCDQLDRRGAWT